MMVWARRKYLVRAVYCDFSRAFDVIDNQLLLNKLSYGFSDSIINIIIIQVKGNNTLSDILHGSCFGHLLYSKTVNFYLKMLRELLVLMLFSMLLQLAVIHETAYFNNNGV